MSPHADLQEAARAAYETLCDIKRREPHMGSRFGIDPVLMKLAAALDQKDLGLEDREVAAQHAEFLRLHEVATRKGLTTTAPASLLDWASMSEISRMGLVRILMAGLKDSEIAAALAAKREEEEIAAAVASAAPGVGAW